MNTDLSRSLGDVTRSALHGDKMSQEQQLSVEVPVCESSLLVAPQLSQDAGILGFTRLHGPHCTMHQATTLLRLLQNLQKPAAWHLGVSAK